MSDTGNPLTRQLEAWQPRTLLAIGEDAARLLEDFAEASPGCTLDIVEAENASKRLLSLKNERRYDFALVAAYLEKAGSEEAGVVIARLRDVLARRLCVIVRDGDENGGETGWSDAEFTAFGFTLLSRFEEDGKKARLFGFDIASYKQTPDWLNPRHWAHPELWGKFRW